MPPIAINHDRSRRRSRRLSSNELAGSLTHGGSRGGYLVPSPLKNPCKGCINDDEISAEPVEFSIKDNDNIRETVIDETTDLLFVDENDAGTFNYDSTTTTNDNPATASNTVYPVYVYHDVESNDELTLFQKDYTSTYEEFCVLFQSAFPLIITFLLQNSFSVASIFSVGHLGKKELAGITLGSMTANITGYAAIQGLSTCLDTLCCQAYGARRYHLVGIYLQRCVALILTAFVPICLFWFFAAESTILFILPKSELGDGNKEDLARLAANYLKVVSIGVPGFVIFECGKRFLQAQGIFHASTYILLICAPINICLNYLLVWNDTVGIGFLGAPLSVAIVNWLMAIGLIVFTVTTKHPANVMKSWGGLNVSLAFQHWNRMFHLAVNGLIMVEAEFLAFEILTIFSSYLGIIALDANSVVSSITALTYQIPFAVSIAGSTRLANYIGASLPNCAKKCCQVTLLVGGIVAIFNCAMVFLFKRPIASLFTSDPEVIDQVVDILKIIAVIQLFDAMNSVTAGLLRGEGMQHIGSITNLSSYYIIGLPLAYFLTFKMGFGLQGLWIGTGVGLFCISVVQIFFSLHVDWDDIISVAQKRNERESNL
ncbi:Erc1 protein [Saccharomycopsis crataegensis]|uniref:Erc1 protein n=1 Tax=Saccharomycopsis crataegensis TaxID=43959 RepID=A0AAV5QL96_9ASCO|nr:Erc1 protein [Saccharomycopsis crataegensis]